MAQPPRTVAVLLDIENIIHAVHKRGYKTLSKKKIKDTAITIVEHIEDIARQYGDVRYRFTALAMPHSSKGPLRKLDASNKARERYAIERKKMNELAFALAELGFETTTCQQAHDAADNVLKRVSKWIIEETDVDVVVLCTEDGGEPFQHIVKDNTSAGNYVHIVGVDRIILTGSFPETPYSLIGGNIRHSTEMPVCHNQPKEQPDTTKAEREPLNSVNGSPANPQEKTRTRDKIRETTKYDYKHLYGNVIKALKEGGRAAAQPDEVEKLLKVVEAIERECRTEKSINQIVNMLTHELSEFNGGISAEELQGIVYALVDFTDCFALQKKYTTNRSSSFVLISRHAEI